MNPKRVCRIMAFWAIFLGVGLILPTFGVQVQNS